MIAFSTARSNRALAIAMVEVTNRVQKPKTRRGRPKAGAMKPAEHREIHGLKAILASSPLFTLEEYEGICRRIDAEMAKPE